jgi:hypothetical protein
LKFKLKWAWMVGLEAVALQRQPYQAEGFRMGGQRRPYLGLGGYAWGIGIWERVNFTYEKLKSWVVGGFFHHFRQVVMAKILLIL